MREGVEREKREENKTRSAISEAIIDIYIYIWSNTIITTLAYRSSLQRGFAYKEE
jgi:hypothetical protein